MSHFIFKHPNMSHIEQMEHLKDYKKQIAIYEVFPSRRPAAGTHSKDQTGPVTRTGLVLVSLVTPHGKVTDLYQF